MNFLRKLVCRIFGHRIQCSDRIVNVQVFNTCTGESHFTPFKVHLITCSRCNETLLPIPQGEAE